MKELIYIVYIQSTQLKQFVTVVLVMDLLNSIIRLNTSQCNDFIRCLDIIMSIPFTKPGKKWECLKYR